MRFLLWSLLLFIGQAIFAQDVHIRLNLLGYLPSDSKVAIILAQEPIEQEGQLLKEGVNQAIFSAKLTAVKGKKNGGNSHINIILISVKLKPLGLIVLK